jgi:signal transduction histidine kinase
MESNDQPPHLHDLVNLLSVISALADSLATRTPPDRPVDPDFIELTRTIDRALDIARRGALPARFHPVSRGAIDLDRFLERMTPRLTHLVGSRLHLAIRPGGSRGPVRANWEQLERILLNLMVNASVSTPDGGRIVVATSASEMPEDTAHGPRLPRRYVRLSVHDNGRGIPADLQQRITESSTTHGERVALGLDSVARTVRQLAGRLQIESEEGAGTVVHVDLPLLQQSPRSPVS